MEISAIWLISGALILIVGSGIGTLLLARIIRPTATTPAAIRQVLLTAAVAIADGEITATERQAILARIADLMGSLDMKKS